MTRRLAYVGASALVALGAACASVQRPASLTQAEGIYSSLLQAGAEDRVGGEMLRAREAIASAQNAVAQKQNQAFVNGLSHIALRLAQTAEAENERQSAQRMADSLRTARLNALLRMSESQRAQLAQQQQLSQEEIAALRERNLLVSQQAESERQRADSLRLVAEQASARLDSALSQLRSLVAEITNIKETTRGLVISLSDILFDVNKSTLKAGAEQNVRRIAAILNQYPNYQISVEGHTDSQGSEAYNQDLSERRAASVREALIAGGVNAGQITSRGFGESQPVASNDTPAGRQQNRRVEVVVLGAGKVADAVRSGGTPPADTTQRDSTRSP